MENLIALVRSTKHFAQNHNDAHSLKQKGQFDYATLVDINIQTYLKKELLERYPDTQLLGEEGPIEDLDLSKPTWILDPIDGTTNLIHDYPQSCVSLGFMENGTLTLGIVYNPFTDELFTASRGQGAFRNGKKILVSSVSTLNDSLLSVCLSPYEKQSSKVIFDVSQKLFCQVQDMRIEGSAAISLCYVAAGFVDAYYAPILHPWDYAAAALILQEAQGEFSTMLGDKLPIGYDSSILASNSNLHKQLLPYTKDIENNL